jgi:hypothetical protein
MVLKMSHAWKFGCLVGALLLTGRSHAVVSGSIWENDVSNDASVVPGGTPDVTFTTSGINFQSGGAYTIGEWISSAGGSVSTGAGELGNTLSDTHMELKGTVFLSAGVNNFNVGHDDGLVVSVAGIGTVLSDPGPTAFVNTPFVINAPASGNYNFTVEYNECCGPPADLLWAFPSGRAVGAPDTGSTAGLLAIAASLICGFRSFRKA